jgi:hypothetical protein
LSADHTTYLGWLYDGIREVSYWFHKFERSFTYQGCSISFERDQKPGMQCHAQTMNDLLYKSLVVLARVASRGYNQYRVRKRLYLTRLLQNQTMTDAVLMLPKDVKYAILLGAISIGGYLCFVLWSFSHSQRNKRVRARRREAFGLGVFATRRTLTGPGKDEEPCTGVHDADPFFITDNTEVGLPPPAYIPPPAYDCSFEQ